MKQEVDLDRKLDRLVANGLDFNEVFDKFLKQWTLICINTNVDKLKLTFASPDGELIEIKIHDDLEGFTFKKVDEATCYW